MTAVPSTTWRMLALRARGKELPKGLDAAWDAASGRVGRLVPRRARYLRLARRVLKLEKTYADLADAKLREAAVDFRDRFRCGRDTRQDRIRAFALVREVAHRQIGEKPYLVQVAAALALFDGCVAELATGEGKTLSATMPATIAGWRGKGCHVVTVNDYLARRDAEWMSVIYRFCGLRAAHVDQEMDPPGRRSAYDADITYLTNKEVAADFLRDRLSLGRLRDLSGARSSSPRP